MIEDIFLAYANNLLKNNPQNFYSIIEEIEKYKHIIIDKDEFAPIIKYIIELSEYIDSQDFLSNVEKRGGINHYDDRFDNDLYHAVEAIAGDRITFYSDQKIWEKQKYSKKLIKELLAEKTRHWFNCNLRKTVKEYTGQDFCEDQFLQKCYECHQLNFRYCLLQIVNGKEYSEIDEFLYDVCEWSTAISSSKTYLSLSKEKKQPFSEWLVSVKELFLSFDEFQSGFLGNSYHALNNFIFAIASYSLTEFLVSNDRRKIKYCPYCEKFFIAKDIKRKNCCYSNDCIRKWERDKKKDQREKDPVKYI